MHFKKHDEAVTGFSVAGLTFQFTLKKSQFRIIIHIHTYNRLIQGIELSLIHISVFLSLILTCICALMGGLFESARAAGSGWYMQMALNSSLDSLMSCYHREIWDKYRIFVLECADKERLAAEMEPQMEMCIRDSLQIVRVSVNKMTSKVQSEKNLSLKQFWQTACNDLNSL